MATLVINKKATFNYEILDKLEAGLELFGHEVKSLRGKLGSLDGAYALIRGGEAFLINMYIPAYQPGNTDTSYDPYRNRKLLLTKKEIAALSGTEREKGLTLVPLSVYNSKRRIKISLALAKGKKKFDKRETIKKRESDREIRRSLKF